MSDELAAAVAQKDAAYRERDCCVAAIAAMAQQLGWPCGLGRHEEGDPGWDPEWMNVVFVEFPTGQCSWHVHDSELGWFSFLPRYERPWDGHTSATKYARIGAWAQGERKPVEQPEAERVLVELRTDLGGDLRAVRATMSRVPCAGEVVRILWMVNGCCEAFRFLVRGVDHVADTDAYPRRHGALDAWVECESLTSGPY